jgi:hypothetical protein
MTEGIACGQCARRGGRGPSSGASFISHPTSSSQEADCWLQTTKRRRDALAGETQQPGYPLLPASFAAGDDNTVEDSRNLPGQPQPPLGRDVIQQRESRLYRGY